MAVNNIHLAFLFCFTLIVINCDQNIYNKDKLYERYPDYGESWMFMPDGDGTPKIALLAIPDSVNPKIRHSDSTISFHLFTRINPNGEAVSLEKESLLISNFDPDKETKIITHGWMSSGTSNTCLQIKDAYLQEDDYNVFIYDWQPVANNIIYPIVALKVESVGVELAKFIDLLICGGLDRKIIHLIGHSLGAHVSGVAGSKFKDEKLGRITGLDPAGPFFYSTRTDRLTNDSADFVDVIHTAGWVIGYGDSIGTADFYPNGGTPPQPGCFGLPEIIEGCSHARSWILFRHSINNKHTFMAKKCSNFDNFKNNKCDDQNVYMGEHARTDVRGNFYLLTENVL